MSNIKGLILTLVVGLFFLIGFLLIKNVKKQKQLILFSTALAFTVMLGMIFFDIIPEIGEHIIELSIAKKWFTIIGCSALGMFLLKCLDLVIPHHHHEHKDKEKNKKEHQEHLFHISFVTSVSLILHNIIEGMSIYITSISNFKAGIMLMLAVSLHNIPLGIEIALGLNSIENKKSMKWISVILLCFSSFIGAMILFLLGNELNQIAMGCLLCITLGMLLYIALFELLKEMWMHRKELAIYYGMVLELFLT